MKAASQINLDLNPTVPVLVDQEAHLIVETIWKWLEAELTQNHKRFPEKVIWLNGAPGAGKGTHTRFIIENQKLASEPIIVSTLLQSKEARARMEAGLMAGDLEALELILKTLIQPDYTAGAIVDGCPRTPIQAAFIYHLYKRIQKAYQTSKALCQYPVPEFHLIVLFVEESESVARQIKRGQQAIASNHPTEMRKTDLDPTLARKRYTIFQELTYPSLKSLESVFPYHFINAQGSIEEVQNLIMQTFQSTS